MRRFSILAYVVLFGLATLVSTFNSAGAVPITFTFDGASGSGSIGVSNFTNKSFTITGTADTASVQTPAADVYFIDHISASIDIQDVGTFGFITATRTFFNNHFTGFSRAGAAGSDLYNGPSHASLYGWDMTTDIGPVFDFAHLLQWANPPVLTTGGTLFFNDGSTEAAFAASLDVAVVPVPSPFVLFATGLGLLGGAGWIRRRKTMSRG